MEQRGRQTTFIEPKRRCSICKKEYSGWGHNAWPLNKGRCCAECNQYEVVPARFELIRIQNAWKKVK